MNEINSFSELHENIKTVLENPANYADKITRFSAGGLGACAYSDDITVGELARCWQHTEYRIKCLHCKEDAYITFWAGKVNSGGYWEIKAYCPHCGKECRYDMSAAGNACRVHWTALRKILQEEREFVKNETARLNKRDGVQSLFPFDKYKVWVQRDDLPCSLANMHVYHLQDGWEIKVFIQNGDLWQVVNYGNRNKDDGFVDIVMMVKDWFRLSTLMPERVGTNQEAAQYEWDACNDD